MKKFLSLIAAVLFAGSMMATEVIFTNADFAGQGTANTGSEVSAVKDGVTFTFTKGYSADESLRCYAHGALTITAEATITKINFTTTGGKTGGLDAEVDVNATSYSVDDLASQARFTEIKVTLAGEAPAVATPVISGEEEFTESVVVTITCSTPEADIYYTTDGTTDPKCDCAAAPEYTQQIVLTETTTIMAAAYTGNAWSAVATKTFTKKEPLVAISCLEVYQKAKNDAVLLNPVTVTYSNGANVWVMDGSASMLIYLPSGFTNNFQAGDVLTGVAGVVDIYQNIVYEVKPDATQAAAIVATPGEAPAPSQHAVIEATDVNQYVILPGFSIEGTFTTDSKTSLPAALGTDTVTIYNNFKFAYTFEAGKTYNITGVVSAYKGNPQVYFISAEEATAPVEMTAIYDWAGEVGTTILGTSGVEISTVKIHTNTDAIPGIKFGSSYVYADGKYIAIKPAKGGFKAGDVLSLAAVFNNADDTKYAQVDLRAADGDTRIWLSDSASTINGRTKAEEPIVQTYTLEADQDSLLLGRYGNTGMFITLLKVERAGGETPVEPETIPTTAPAVPAHEEANVMGIYCNHYATNNANFGISGWAGGYQTLDLDGTMAAYWTGMTWECIIDPANTDAAHDFSAYENIHVDMWAPAAAKIKFTAEAIAGGNYKDGQVLDLVQGWNSFDIAIADWTGNYDFANLKCFALEQYQTPAGESFEGNPFAIANIYFWNAPVAIDTYTVAGSSAIAFGTTWDPANAANDMALQEDGTYKWEKENLELAEGEIAFKVCENHAWTHAWPAQDYKLAIPEAGLYTVTITFNPAAESDQVAAVAQKTGEAVVLPNVILHGNFTGSWADTDPFVAAADKLTAALTLTLAEGTYEFGFKFDGTWKANGANITREANTANLATGEGNMHITADVAGDYVLVYTFATQELVVTYPVNALTIPENAPVPEVDEDDVMAIYCNHYANNNANFGISGWAGGYQTLVLNEINVGYWTGMTWECIIDPAHTDDAHDYSAYKNLHVDLWAPLPAKIKFTAEEAVVNGYKDGQFVEMQQGWNSVDFVVAEWAGNYDFKNLKCFVFEQYQTLEGENFEGNPFAFANIYFYGKEAQGIDNTNVEMNAVKFIENGQLIILKNGVKYNVMGVIVR